MTGHDCEGLGPEEDQVLHEELLAIREMKLETFDRVFFAWLLVSVCTWLMLQLAAWDKQYSSLLRRRKMDTNKMYYRIRNVCGILGMVLPWLAPLYASQLLALNLELRKH